MAKYKVIALSVGGKGNKIYRAGDTVTDECWSEGRAKELAEQGFLEQVDGKALTFDGYTVSQIKELLDAKGVAYGPNDTKGKLYEKLIAV
jgi:hypothetical protein